MEKKLIQNVKGELSVVIDICIGLFVAGILLSAALLQIASGNYTDVNPAVVTVVTVLLPVLGVLAIAMVYVRKVSKK